MQQLELAVDAVDAAGMAHKRESRKSGFTMTVLNSPSGHG